MPHPPSLSAARRPQARTATRQSLASARQAWEAGRRAKEAGQWRNARAHFQRAVQLAPQDPLYRLNLARAAHALGENDTAIREAGAAFDLDRSDAVACEMLGHALQRARRHREVIESLDSLDPSTPRSAGWYLCRANAWLEMRDFARATQDASSALALGGSDRPLRLKTLRTLGHGLSMLRRHDEAGLCYRMVVDADPLALGCALYAAHYSAWACDWPNLQTDLDRVQASIDRIQAMDDPTEIEALSPFCLLTLTDNPEVLHWTARLACLKGQPDARAHRPDWQVPRPNGRLRIGLLSADFHMHATSMLIVELLESMDRQRYEWVFYSGGPDDGSDLRARVRATATLWHETREWSTQALTEQVQRDEVGVLIDMKGFTLGSRMTVLAERAAPLQLSWLGYPGTTGASYIDYVIGDPVVTPLEAQPHYSESIAQMPHCYQPNDSQRSRPQSGQRCDHGLPEEGFVFASFNQSYKIVPEVFDAWCHILAGTPGSVLWLLVPPEETRQRLRQEAAARGIDPQRLVFAPFMDIDEHRARLPLADLFLDSFPCSGHTTASDALWAGVPVVTLIGQAFASRVAASLLHTLGLDELVCEQLDDYVQQAMHFGCNPLSHGELRARLQQACEQSALFDGRRYAQDFAALLERMVERQNLGLPPAPLAALNTTATTATTTITTTQEEVSA